MVPVSVWVRVPASFDALDKLRKATASFVMYVYLFGSSSVRQSVLIEQLVSHHTDFHET
jgi:hypothetical protein